MGIKGEKQSQDSVITAELLLEKLSTLGEISSKRMFGGHGLFIEGKMFCIVDSKGQAFLKVGDSNRGDFEKKGAGKHNRMPYYSIPEDVFNNLEDLIQWSEKSINLVLQ